MTLRICWSNPLNRDAMPCTWAASELTCDSTPFKVGHVVRGASERLATPFVMGCAAPKAPEKSCIALFRRACAEPDT